MGSSAPITGYCVHLLHGLHTPTCIFLVPLTWHRRQHWHLQIYGTHGVKVFWDRRNVKAAAELVKSESAGAWKVSNEFVESWIGSNCIKGTAAPLNSLKKTSVTSRRHLNLNVKRILRNEGLPKTPCNFTSIRYLSVDTDPLWLLDILRCCVLLELSQTQRL